jgi:hypothetical protein
MVTGHGAPEGIEIIQQADDLLRGARQTNYKDIYRTITINYES